MSILLIVSHLSVDVLFLKLEQFVTQKKIVKYSDGKQFHLGNLVAWVNQIHNRFPLNSLIRND